MLETYSKTQFNKRKICSEEKGLLFAVEQVIRKMFFFHMRSLRKIEAIFVVQTINAHIEEIVISELVKRQRARLALNCIEYNYTLTTNPEYFDKKR